MRAVRASDPVRARTPRPRTAGRRGAPGPAPTRPAAPPAAAADRRARRRARRRRRRAGRAGAPHRPRARAPRRCRLRKTCVRRTSRRQREALGMVRRGTLAAPPRSARSPAPAPASSRRMRSTSRRRTTRSPSAIPSVTASRYSARVAVAAPVEKAHVADQPRLHDRIVAVEPARQRRAVERLVLECGADRASAGRRPLRRRGAGGGSESAGISSLRRTRAPARSTARRRTGSGATGRPRISSLRAAPAARTRSARSRRAPGWSRG